MNREPQVYGGETWRAYRVNLLVVMMGVAGFATGCAHQIPALFAPMQADGWSAQPIAINSRFTSDASMDPASGTPVGDEGFSLYVLTNANRWDCRDSQSFIRSFVKHPKGHTWLILESPQSRLECGHSGNNGLMQPAFHESLFQRIRDGDPNPVACLWQTVNDGQFELGNPNQDPTFVWKMPITHRAHTRIHEYIMNREYDRFSLSIYNCGEMVTKAAALAGVNLTSMIRITFPDQLNVQGHTLRIWTDPRYSMFEFRSIDVLEEDLRYLSRLGIGVDVTEEYRGTRPYQPLVSLDHPRDLRPSVVSEPSRR